MAEQVYIGSHVRWLALAPGEGLKSHRGVVEKIDGDMAHVKIRNQRRRVRVPLKKLAVMAVQLELIYRSS